MNKDESIIIIGAGVAGIHAAQTLRTENYRGNITLFDQSSDKPYDRPPLSKEFMSGEAEVEDVEFLTPVDFEALNIDWKPQQRIVSLDCDQREVVSSDGEQYKWNKLLIATGSKLRQLDVRGAHLKNIFYLKTLTDAKRIRNVLGDVKKIAIVGAGFIGAELASTFNELDIEVMIIERAHRPMQHIFGEEIGNFFLNLHKDNGVEVIIGDSVQAFSGDKHVEQIITSDGKVIDCDAAVIGIGVEPNTPFLNNSLKIDKGYVVDEFGETSSPGIFASGDCTVWPYMGNYIHVEHWDHAVFHSQAVARNMVSKEKKLYDRVPYFWSDQYGHRIQYLGHIKEWDSTILRGDLKSGNFTCFYLDEKGIIQAALIVNEPKHIMPIRRLISLQQQVNKEQLADTTVSIRSVLNKLNKVKP